MCELQFVIVPAFMAQDEVDPNVKISCVCLSNSQMHQLFLTGFPKLWGSRNPFVNLVFLRPQSYVASIFCPIRKDDTNPKINNTKSCN